MTDWTTARVVRDGEGRLRTGDGPIRGLVGDGLVSAESAAAYEHMLGPITAVLDADGLPDYNYPAFMTAATKLRDQGHHVENPADGGPVDGWAWADYMRRGIGQLITCDTIALLPDWHASRGALIEQRLASELGMQVWVLDHEGRVVTRPAHCPSSQLQHLLQLRAAFTVACSWLFGTPARLTGWLVAYRLSSDLMRATASQLWRHGRRAGR